MVWERLKEVCWQYSEFVVVDMDVGLMRRTQFGQGDGCWVGNNDCNCGSINEVSNNQWQCGVLITAAITASCKSIVIDDSYDN